MTKQEIVVLTVRRGRRILQREACRIQNEALTLSGKYPTRFEELKAVTRPGNDVTREVVHAWPDWLRRKNRNMIP
jgi:hypothetical protein